MVLAPSIAADALQLFAKKANVRVLAVGELAAAQSGMEYKRIAGGLLVQDADTDTLAAADLNFIPLTTTFVAAGSDEMRQAVAQLRARTPLGSTDMNGLLTAAAAAFPAEAAVSSAGQGGRVRAVAHRRGKTACYRIG